MTETQAIPTAAGIADRTLGDLRGLPASARDIEIVRPSLDDLYAAFQKGAT